MNRITIEEIQEAYERTGAQPTTEEWGDAAHNSLCPMGVCAFDKGLDIGYMGAETVSETLGLPFFYVEGFICAIDGEEEITYPTQEAIQGFEDGLEVRRELFGEED